jgi:hypothetical protein
LEKNHTISDSVADPDPHHCEKLVLDSHQSGKLDLDPVKYQSKKQDPDPHQSEKVEALEGYFGA